MAGKRIRIAATAATAVIAVVALGFVLFTPSGDGTGSLHRLPDGSTLELRQVTWTATNFFYSHHGGGPLARVLYPMLPQSVARRFWPQAGGLGFGPDGSTNLFVVTVHHGTSSPGWSSDLARLVVFDDQGNEFDSSWGTATCISQGEVAQAWRINSFPRRNRMLGLRFISLGSSMAARWKVAAEFRIRNPAHADSPQWEPEPWPVTRTDGDLSVTLRGFYSGQPRLNPGEAPGTGLEPRNTRVELAFMQHDQPAGNWRIQKFRVYDATGNDWSPYLNFVNQELNWVTNGTVEFLGALWPGEKAWRLDFECIRTAGFSADETWETPLIPLPGYGALNELSNSRQFDGARVRLVALASPNTDHPDPFKWICKWWGDDKNKIYSLAMKLEEESKGHRLFVVQAADQDGRNLEIVQHGNQDYPEQVVFVKPSPEARALKLTLAVQRSRFVHFLVRPAFLNAGSTNPATGP